MRIISGTARSRQIATPEGKDTRPTLDRVRENLFNILQNRIYSSYVLDLFAGSGALSLEALSRGASFAIMCDIDRKANRVEKLNVERLGFSDRTEIYCCDWRTALKNLKSRGMKFDLVFLDPPYKMTDLREVFDELEDLTVNDSIVTVEHEAKQSVLFGKGFVHQDERKWGFCGISFYGKKTDSNPEVQEVVQ